MGAKNTECRFKYDHEGGNHDEDALDKNREKLHFSVPVRVVFISRLCRKIDTEECESACQNIDDALGGIGQYKI